MYDPNFLLVLNCDFPSIYYRFQVISICLQTGNDVIAISPQGGATRQFWIRNLKDRSVFPISAPLQLLFYLVPFWSYIVNKFWLGFPIPQEKFGGFWGKWPPKFVNFLFRPQKGTSLVQNASFEPSSVKIHPGVRAVDERKRKKMDTYIHTYIHTYVHKKKMHIDLILHPYAWVRRVGRLLSNLVGVLSSMR